MILDDDPRWFQRAVFYEVFVRAFNDASGDGNGDLRGITAKLDYLEWLGVDCVWLLPIFASPLRDGGYDISDFTSVHPAYGNIEDMVELTTEAHRRGVRVIIDLVLNHTSDVHQWFVESRQDRTNPKADWYVWADDDQGYPGVPIIFHDVERSNWTWDPVRQQYYWHRFFHHQPDLNYANPEVQEAMLAVCKFWLDHGVDGFRLDAVPYLFEAEGTLCQNLPETHAFLKRLRREIDASHPGRVLLAEANQWPTELRDYFGEGDECHMCFNFPLMPRIYLSAKRGNRMPIEMILNETPDLPEGCSWGLFLRNHDELTLEMVTDAERDEMYGEYAADPMMRRNSGIGRRLAPLLNNNRVLMELFHSLLLSLPGSPVMYYGDELGMGDNIHLGDRDGVRTPMQWTPDRNGGFSTAPPEQLYLPPINDVVYGVAAVNVESQQLDRSSFLHWLRQMILVRRNHPQLATGLLTQVIVDNPAIFAYVRGIAGQATNNILCVANLSSRAQPALLPLESRAGFTPVELMGGVTFPVFTKAPYQLSLPPHGFFWFELFPPVA